VTPRGPALLLAAAVLAAGCAEDRPRPAPPFLSIHFDHDTIPSPDTLRGTISATDEAGIDSLWLQVGSGPVVGVDGGFQLSFQAPFWFVIDSGLLSGTKIPVSFSARNIVGYADVLDTFVVVRTGP